MLYPELPFHLTPEMEGCTEGVQVHRTQGVANRADWPPDSNLANLVISVCFFLKQINILAHKWAP